MSAVSRAYASAIGTLVQMVEAGAAFRRGSFGFGFAALRAALTAISLDVGRLLRNSSAVNCPCCGWSANEFYPVASGPHTVRRHELCLGCGSRARHRQLAHYLTTQTDFLSEGALLLDIAPMRAFRTVCLSAGVRYVSIDLSSSLAMTLMDLRSLGFPDGAFDRVICYHVLEHIIEHEMCMRELHRVMRAGAVGILQVPINPDLDETVEYGEPRKDEFGHVRCYGQDYADRLADAGFHVEFQEYEVDEEVERRFGFRSDVLHLVTKPL